MLFTTILTTTAVADFTSEQCSTQSKDILCNNTAEGSFCGVVGGVCTELCTTATPSAFATFDDDSCRAVGGLNCVANGAADACVIATTCSDVVVSDTAVEGDKCAPTATESCEVVKDASGLKCEALTLRSNYLGCEGYQCPISTDEKWTPQGLYCVYSADNPTPQCVPGCELQTGADDAACEAFGKNCVHDGSAGCKYADSCAAVSPPDDVTGTGDIYCAPDITNDKDCVYDETTTMCADKEWVVTYGSCEKQECAPTSFDVTCFGIMDASGTLSCTESCSAVFLSGVAVSDREARCKETGPNCEWKQGDYCSFAETCADITPPANATAGDSCAPNMASEVDCFVDANGACSDTSTPTTSPSTTVPLDTVDGVSSVASMVTLVVASMMLF